MNDIQIDAQSIPLDANVRADLLSRFVDKHDWSLNCEIFAHWIPGGACILLIHVPLIIIQQSRRERSSGKKRELAGSREQRQI